MFLKVLAAIALILVSVAAGTYVIRSSRQPPALPPTPPPSIPVKPEPGRAPTSRVETEAPRPAGVREIGRITGPTEIPANDRIQPSYRPINEPAILQELRKAGKTYHSSVVGKVSGKGEKQDWGLHGAAYFTYFYGYESDGHIISNDGNTVVEDRSFKKVKETLLVSSYEIGIELGESPNKFLGWLQSMVSAIGGKDAGEVVQPVREVVGAVSHFRLPISSGFVDSARQSGIFKTLPSLDPKKIESEMRLFATGTDQLLLENKKVRITFENGRGIRELAPIDCELSAKEGDVIRRANFVLDHYIFPDGPKSPGESWEIDSSAFAGLLDPRLAGQASGKTVVVRQPDFVDAQNAVAKRLRIREGNLTVRDVRAKAEITGELHGLRGNFLVPEKDGVISSATVSGTATYQNVGTDHFLFQAQMSVTPVFEIRYVCTVD
ncbi:MAG TPA: hypothetical protein VGO11_25555 [Chthoniobacteraceae bacterium]|jgi:hypothetical protein|nr:hypothetical protein [Chthoniobacteraceae bacterium]